MSNNSQSEHHKYLLIIGWFATLSLENWGVVYYVIRYSDSVLMVSSTIIKNDTIVQLP